MRSQILSLIVILGVSIFFVPPATADEVPAPCGEETPCEEQLPIALSVDADIANLTYDELKSLLDSAADFVLLDTRTPAAYQQGHIPQAESFPLSDMTPESIEKLPKDKLIVVYCQSASCQMSHSAAIKIKALGYDVKDYKGGIEEWAQKGHTLEQDTKISPPAAP